MLRKVALLALFVSANAFAQNQPSPLNPTSWGVVYDVPATKQVTLRADVPYLRDDRGTLTLDIYSPPKMKVGEKRPAAVMVALIGAGDGGGKLLKPAAAFSGSAGEMARRISQRHRGIFAARFQELPAKAKK